MPRRKITDMKELRHKGLRGYEAIWSHVVAFKSKNFAATDIELQTNAHRQTVKDYLKRLERAGYIEIVSCEARKPVYYRLLKSPVIAPRLRRDGTPVTQGKGNDHMWRSIKMLGNFTIRDLALNASTEEVKVTDNAAKAYIKFLHKAGYIKIIKPHNNTRDANSQAIYRMLPGKNTGPKAPMIQRIKQVYDPNLEKVVWPPEDEVRHG